MAAQYTITTPPAVDPVTLAEAKQHARNFIDDDADDAYMTSLIVAAREKLEGSVCRSFITRSVEARLDGFPATGRTSATYLGRSSTSAEPLRLLYPPLQSVESITYIDADGDERTLDPAAYVVVPGTPGIVAPAPGASWPATIDRPGSVVVAFTAGYGDDPADVPEVAKLVIKILVSHWYDRREPIAAGSFATLPFMVDALSDSLRWGEYP
jgi:uncharacterized phiE125 gp8 family phage protein